MGLGLGRLPVNDETTGVIRYSASEPRGVLFVLAHGAGAGQRHPFMTGMARGLAARGIDVVTFDFPYMRQRRKVPDKAPVLESCFRDVVTSVRSDASAGAKRLFIGGKSMGGRMATHLASQGLEGLEGVVALGYPLHPPGKPEQLRVGHLPGIAVPLLVVQGERDTFGTPQELAAPLQSVAGPVALHVVSGGDHSLAVRGSAKAAVFDGVVHVVADWILGDPSTRSSADVR